MRKFLILMVSMVALLSTGCTVQVGGTSAPSASVSSTPSDAPETSVEDPDTLFLSVVRDEYPELNSVADHDLVQIAKDACTMLDNGGGIDDLFNVFGNSGNDDVDGTMAFIIGAGIVAYCPEYSDQVSGGLNT